MSSYLNSNKQNPIMYAAQLQHWEAVEFLSSRGVFSEASDHQGQTVLLRALAAYQFELATKLIRRGSDINATNREGRTALSHFLCDGKYKVVDFLLKMAANPHIMDFDGMDSCDYAAQQGFQDFKQLLNCQPESRVMANIKQKAVLDEGFLRDTKPDSFMDNTSQLIEKLKS